MNKIKRIIFFSSTKFNKRDFNRFGIETIQQRGYDVEFWEFSYLFNEIYKEYKVPDPIDFNGYKKINTKKSAELAISKLSSDDIIVDAWLLCNDRTMYNSVKDHVFKIGFLLLGLLPDVIPDINKNKITFLRRIYNFFIILLKTPKQAIKKIFFHIKRNHFLSTIIERKKPVYDFLLIGGNANFHVKKYKLNIDNHTDIIKAHAFDYDHYLEQNKYDENLSHNPFAVFLDEDVPCHPDYNILGIEPYCDKKTYYSEINTFFRDFELKTGLKVIVAAHPRSDKKTQKKNYEERKTFSNKTVQLIKQSECVIAHASTAINGAVLYNKKLILIDSDHYKQRYRNHIRSYSILLNTDLINISNQNSAEISDNEFDKEKYQSYMDLYIKESGTPNKFVWEIFCDYCDNLTK